MKITLKSIKTSGLSSHETICFQAVIYADGKKVGHAENSGHGGDTFIHAAPEVLKALEAHAATFPPLQVGDTAMPHRLEYLIDDLVNDHLEEKTKAAWDKRKSAWDIKIAALDAENKAKRELRGEKCLRVSTEEGKVWWVSFKSVTEINGKIEELKKQGKKVKEWRLL